MENFAAIVKGLKLSYIFIFTLFCGTGKGFMRAAMEILYFYFDTSLRYRKRFYEGNNGNTTLSFSHFFVVSQKVL